MLLWLWLWSRPAAEAPIGPLAWELPYAAGAAIKRKKKCAGLNQIFCWLFLSWLLPVTSFVKLNRIIYPPLTVIEAFKNK